jgi:[ribosomal protein S18]-alanine N-acetyltransferase
MIYAMGKGAEYILISRSWVKALAQFFVDIAANNDTRYFHPHPFTFEMAEKIAAYEGKDLYFLQVKDCEITGYAMLRGWDENFTIPSLGIVIHPTFRDQGLGKEFMPFLHDQARRKRAKKVRLKVHSENEKARKFYEKLGYRFTDEENGQLIGYHEL